MPDRRAWASIHGGILEILAKREVRCEQRLMQLGETFRLMPPDPVGSSQGAPRIGQMRRPVERDSLIRTHDAINGMTLEQLRTGIF